MTATNLGTRDGDRTEQRLRPWTRVDTGADALVRLEPPRTLWRGTLRREADRLVLTPCGGDQPGRVGDVSPGSAVTAALTDLGFDRLGRVNFEAFGTRRQYELKVEQLNRAGVEMGRPTQAISSQALGQEPGSRLVASPGAVRLVQAGGATLSAPLSWRWPAGRPDRAVNTWAASTEASALNAALGAKIGRDAMADNVYGFSAQVAMA